MNKMKPNPDRLADYPGINLRQKILELIPYREYVTIDQKVEIVKDHFRFTPEHKMPDLFGRIKDRIESLLEEGILEGNWDKVVLNHEHLRDR